MAWVTPINWLAKAVGYDVTRADMQTISGDLTWLKARQIASAGGTAVVTVTSVTEAAPTVILQLPSASYDGTKVRLEFCACGQALTPCSVGHSFILAMYETGAAELGQVYQRNGVVAGAASGSLGISVFYEFTPAAGAHTYCIGGFKTDAADVVQIWAGAGEAAYAPMLLTATYV